MRLGTDTGSLVNHVLAAGPAPEPEVGMPATVLRWTDRSAGTVVEVFRDRRGAVTGFLVQLDRAIRLNPGVLTDAQNYRYERDPRGVIYRFRWSRSAQGWRVGGRKNDHGVSLGVRDHFVDPSF